MDQYKYPQNLPWIFPIGQHIPQFALTWASSNLMDSRSHFLLLGELELLRE